MEATRRQILTRRKWISMIYALQAYIWARRKVYTDAK